jgi:hypothetical protein
MVFYFIGIGFLLLVPAIIGTFWAAPLLTREFEAGTFQLAWTQSVTRTRWLAAKLGVGALAAVAAAGLFSLMLTWWSGPIDTAAPFAKGISITFLRLGFVLFPTRGITPLGYAAFAFALGVTAGVLLRRVESIFTETRSRVRPQPARFPETSNPAHLKESVVAQLTASFGVQSGLAGANWLSPLVSRARAFAQVRNSCRARASSLAAESLPEDASPDHLRPLLSRMANDFRDKAPL